MHDVLPPPPPPAAALTGRCRIGFGRLVNAPERCPRGPLLGIGLPVLGGPSDEELLHAAAPSTTPDGCTLFRSDDRLAGYCIASTDTDLETAARQLYGAVFAAAGDLHLYRVWNYVPAINAFTDGLEHYRRFSRGRSIAFEDRFGPGFERRLPAASAVGTPRGPLALAFLAGAAAPRHFENPRQVPAFAYPAAYGPRPPSFSRATLVTDAVHRELFISGTAAIRGHASVAVNDLAQQLACTRENLDIIAETAGAGPRFGATQGWQRSLKVYLRRDTDYAAVRADLEQHLLRPTDAVTYLQADLCRSELLVEVEAVLTK